MDRVYKIGIHIYILIALATIGNGKGHLVINETPEC